MAKKSTVKAASPIKTKAKKTAPKEESKKPIKKILISQPKPSSEKSPYYDLAKKYNVELVFNQFISVHGLGYKDFRKQNIEFADYTGIIFLSRNAVDHFFRLCEELKFKVSPELRYFCVTEAVALYLQKFIIYRKRKVFFSADGSPDGLMDVLEKYKSREKFLMPVSEDTKNDISPLLKKDKVDFVEAVMYKTVSNDLSHINSDEYDIILLFSPFGIEAVNQELPKVKKAKTIIGAFGSTTSEATKKAGYNLQIIAPTPKAPSMVTALEHFIKEYNK